MASEPKTVRRVKIPSKVNPDEKPESQGSNEEFQRELLEVIKSMDWKMWESLKSLQRIEKALSASEIVADVEEHEK